MSDARITPSAASPGAEAPLRLAVAVLTEAGIVSQLANALLQAHLPQGMVAAQFAVLNHLATRPAGQTPLRIARAFQVPKTSMTHSLSVLAARRLIETVPNPDDGRSKLVRMTVAGGRFREGVVAALGPDMARALAGLEPGTLEALLPRLTHLREVLDGARDGNVSSAASQAGGA